MFVHDISLLDWTSVYIAKDVDVAVKNFTDIFSQVLDFHAPWIKFQQRNNYIPWLSEKTKELIKQRDQWKALANKAEKNSKMPGFIIRN